MSFRRVSGVFALVLLVSVVAVPAAVAAAPQGAAMRSLPGRQIEVRAGETTQKLRPIMPTQRTGQMSLLAHQSVVPTATADIQVTYHGFSQAAQDAFQVAVDIWETQIVSDQVIHVDATWKPLGTGVLGSAGPESFYIVGQGIAAPVALVEAQCSCETNAPYEIEANFNSNFGDWYLGTDGNPPASKYDFVTVVMHEIGHGLGFLSSFEVFGGLGYWGLTDNQNNVYALRFDKGEWTAQTNGVLMTSYNPNGSATLKKKLTDGTVFFGGPETVAANGGRAALYAPSTWNRGSSNSHFDEDTFPAGTENALMTPFLDNGEVIHMPGPLTLALFRDIGWTTADEAPSETDPPVVSAPVGTVLEAQKIGATALLHVSWPDATDASGIASYQLQRKQGSGSFTNVTLPFATATAVDVALTPGTAYQFRLRATDTEGNTSDWVTTPSGTLALLQENAVSVVYAGAGWKRVSLSGASGGKVKKAGTAGHKATLSFSGTSVAFVSTRSPQRGIAEIWLDGVFQESVDLYRSSISKRWVIWAPSAPLSAGAHTLEVRVTGVRNPSSSKNRIDIDAFLTWP